MPAENDVNPSTALAITAPSAAFRSAIEARLGTSLHWLDVQALRERGLPFTWRALRAISGPQVIIALETADAETFAPLLAAYALMTHAHQATLIDARLHPLDLSRAALWRLAVHVANAALGGAAAALRQAARMIILQRQIPMRFTRRCPSSVLYVDTNIRNGVRPLASGALAHTIGVLNGMADIGLEVDCWRVWRAPEVRESVRYHAIARPTEPPFPLALYLQRFSARAEAAVARGTHERPDVIYQRMTEGDVTGVALSRRLRAPLVLEYNGSEVRMARMWGTRLRFEGLARLSEAVCLRHAHRIVAVAEPLREELLAKGVAPERIVVAPNGVDTERFDPDRFDTTARQGERAAWGVPAEAVVVTFLGTFGAWHGAEVLAEAVASLATKDEDAFGRLRAHVVFAGDGPRLAAVRAIIDRSAARAHCTFTGLVPQERAPALLAASDVLISPQGPQSDGRPFIGSPTKLFEYMAMAKGIVASALDQMADVMSPSLDARTLPTIAPAPDAPELGVLCRPSHVNDLAAAIRFLVTQPAWRARLGSNARARACARHTWRAHVMRIVEALE